MMYDLWTAKCDLQAQKPVAAQGPATRESLSLSFHMRYHCIPVPREP